MSHKTLFVLVTITVTIPLYSCSSTSQNYDS